MTRPFLSVVIPAYNEERRLPATLERVVGFLETRDYSWEVVVADDGSGDATGRIVTELAAGRPEIRLLSLPHRGKGGAVKAGMLAALGEYRFLCDADLSMPIEQVERFLPPRLEGVEVGIGSRQAAGSRRIDEPLGRYFTSRVYNRMIRLLLLPGIQDTQCGFKGFRGEAAEELFGRLEAEDYAFDVEVLYTARQLGMGMREVAIDWRYGKGSRVRPVRDGIGMVRDLLRMRRRLRRRALGVAAAGKGG